MATSTRARIPAQEAPPAEAAPPVALLLGRRLALSAACYAGIVLMVALTLLASRVLPAGVGVPLFVACMVGVVALAHPTLRVTHRSR